MGGMAIRAHAPDWPARTRRVEVDLDFATRGKDRGAFYELLAKEGYTADKRHNALFGGKQAYFVDVPRSRPVDVLVDSLEMCHRFEFGDRLAAVDARRCRWPSCCCPSSRSSRSIARTSSMRSSCWPSTRSAQDDGAPDSRHGQGAINVPAHPVVHLERLGLVADRDRQPRHARPVPRRRADPGGPRPRQRARRSCSTRRAQVAALRAAIDDAPKSTKWKLRAQGRRAQGLVPGSRGDGAQLMRIFFATDIHGSEVCWRKFLNAGKFHKADVLIMGGDMTGKAMVPIVADGSNWELELQGQQPRAHDRGGAARRWRSGSATAATTRSA